MKNNIFWESIKNFTSAEFNSDEMSISLIVGLQKVRDYVDRKIIIKSGYRKGKGYHGLKMAADIAIEGLHVVDQYLVVNRFNIFNGIGIYPNWNTPGLHVDIRPHVDYNAQWGCFQTGKYVSLNHSFFKKIV